MLLSILLRLVAPSDTTGSTKSPETMLLLSDLEPGPQATPTITPIPPPVIVYISGAVRQPDVYELPHDARIKDVVLAAGGFAPDADRISTNLASHIEDAQHIHIPRQGETPPPVPERQPEGGDHAVNLANDQSVNINTANATRLQELNGIGETLSQRIIDYRTTNGTFSTIEELANVPGVSSSMVQTLQSDITVGP